MLASLRKVLLIARRFEVRGSSMQTMNLARLLPEAGFAPRILCLDARQIPPARRGGLDITEVPQMEFPWIGRLVRRIVAHDLADDPPELVHVQHRSALDLGEEIAARLDVPVVLSVQDYLSPRELLSFDRLRGHRIIAVSKSVRTELLERTNVDPEGVCVIQSGVELPSDEQLRETFQDGTIPVVGTAGPLEAAKGIEFFLHAIPTVLREHGRVEFLIAGAGPEEQRLRRAAKQLDIAAQVTFVPNVFDLSTSLNAMDVYCLPSLRQGLGTIMLEAMARARPVIASSVGGVYSVIEDGQTGILVPPSDSQALARKILELLDNPPFARAMGSRARQKVREEFPVNRMVAQVAELYHDVLSENTPSPIDR